MRNEAELSKKFTEFLESQNAFVFNVTANKYQKPGMPDLYVTHARTGPFWCELKFAANPATKIQKHIIKTLNQRGANAIILRWEERAELPLKLEGVDTRIGYFQNFPELWKFLLDRWR